MFNFIKKAIRVGVATQSYPYQPAVMDPNFRGKPEHNSQQCIGCAACINACPSNALSAETDLAAGRLQWRFNLGRCIFCARCEEVCPTAAITLSSQYELAVWQKADLQQQASFPLCYCRECSRPFAVQKEIDYVVALLQHQGVSDVQSRRAQFETCPECRRQQCLASSAHINLSRQIREAS